MKEENTVEFALTGQSQNENSVTKAKNSENILVTCLNL